MKVPRPPALSKLAPVVCHPDAVEQAQGSGGRDSWQMERLPPAIRLLHRFAHRFVRAGGPVRISGTVSGGEQVAGFEVVELAGARVPHEAFNLDPARARESVRRLAALRPRIVGVGHVGPLTGPGVVAELEAAGR